MPVHRRGLLAGAVGAVALGPRPSVAVAAPRSERRVRTGIERLIATRYAILRGQRVGVITNPTGILSSLEHEVDVMHGDPAVDLVAVFGPEHGFRGTAQAGGSEGLSEDPRTGLPVYDTYQKSGRALADIFTASGVDTILFDIQDVGARFYTYIWTLYDSMVAAALAGKRFVVLDRPNAISGRPASGPVLHPAYATFVGRKPIAQSHGMTVGELARMFNAVWVPGEAGRSVPLTVVELTGWSRTMYFEDTGLPWVPPSPNMPTVDTAVLYPGTCLFEGTQASEGRGSTRPFEMIGAPYGNWLWAEALTAQRLPGVVFRENYFTPTFAKFAGQTVGGVQVIVTDRRACDPIRTALSMIVSLKTLYPKDFAWRPDHWIDDLTGSSAVREAVDAGRSADEIVASWQGELVAFQRLRAKFLIYGGSR
jgi:uncharacterized protein YbbC (DUF1343 family)